MNSIIPTEATNEKRPETPPFGGKASSEFPADVVPRRSSTLPSGTTNTSIARPPWPKPGSPAWIRSQIAKAIPCRQPGNLWLVCCPVCGDHLYFSGGNSPARVIRSLYRHMQGRIMGLKYLRCRAGDRITVQGEDCEVLETADRPVVHHHYQKVAKHVFFLVVRRVRDNRTLETSCRVPNKLVEHFTKRGKVRKMR